MVFAQIGGCYNKGDLSVILMQRRFDYQRGVAEVNMARMRPGKERKVLLTATHYRLFGVDDQSAATACLRSYLKGRGVHSIAYTDDTLPSLNDLAEDVLSIADDGLVLVANQENKLLVNALACRIAQLEDLPIYLLYGGSELNCQAEETVTTIADGAPEETLAELLGAAEGQPLMKCSPDAQRAALQHIQQRCRERDVLLVADEVATGFGRTGTPFAWQQAEITPDLVCLSKAINNGYLAEERGMFPKETVQQTHDAFRLRMTQSGSHFRMTAAQGEPEPIRVLERPEVVRALQWRKGGLLTDLDEAAMGWLVPELEDLTWEQPQPFRLLYCKGEDLTIFAVHHNFFDYYSLLSFWEELGRRYRTTLLVSPNQHFSDYASQYARLRRTTETRKEALFWEERLSHVEPMDWKRWTQALPTETKAAGVTARVCFQDEDTRQYSLPISTAQRQQLTTFCIRHQVGEFAALFALLVWQIRKYGVKTPTALLFFTAGRSQVQPFNTLGYFSFLMPYVVDGGAEPETFSAFVRQVETELTVLRQREQGFLSLYQQDASQNLIAQSPIVDYQKLYTRAPEAIWSRMRPFECLGVQNPFSFRIFDYGEQAELSVFYRRSAVGLDEADVLRLTRTYIKLWNALFQEPNGSDLC